MREVEASAPTREQAIEHALQELGVEMYEVDKIEILDEGSKGLFGFGARPVRVKVIVEKLVEAPRQPARTRERPVRDGGRQERAPEQGRSRDGGRDQERGRGRRERGPREDDRPARQQAPAEGEAKPAEEQQPARRPQRERGPRDSERSREDRPAGAQRSSRGGRGRGRDRDRDQEQAPAAQEQAGEASREQGEGEERPARAKRSSRGGRGRGRDRDRDQEQAPAAQEQTDQESRGQVEGEERPEREPQQSRGGRDARPRNGSGAEETRARAGDTRDDASPEVDISPEEAAARVEARERAQAEERLREEECTAISDEQGRDAASLLQEIISKMGIEATVVFARGDEGVARLNVTSEDGAILIGRKGRTLGALQYLINRMVSQNDTQENTERLVVDVEGYVDRRRESLEELAKNFAQKAKDTQRNMRLKPLSPQERRVIHLTLQDDADVRTFSIGESLYRSVVISPKDAPSSDRGERPDASAPSRRSRGSRGGRGRGGRGRQPQQREVEIDAGQFGD